MSPMIQDRLFYMPDKVQMGGGADLGLDIMEEEGSEGVTPGCPETLDSADNSLSTQMIADLNRQ